MANGRKENNLFFFLLLLIFLLWLSTFSRRRRRLRHSHRSCRFIFNFFYDSALCICVTCFSLHIALNLFTSTNVVCAVEISISTFLLLHVLCSSSSTTRLCMRRSSLRFFFQYLLVAAYRMEKSAVLIRRTIFPLCLLPSQLLSMYIYGRTFRFDGVIRIRIRC